MVLLALPPPDHLLIERDRGQFVPSRRRRVMANVRAERLLKTHAESSPELRIPGAAAQTRVVSLAGIRLGSWESARARLVSPAQASPPRSWPTPELRIPKRRSSNANCLQSQNSAGFPQICAIFQRDNLQRHF